MTDGCFFPDGSFWQQGYWGFIHLACCRVYSFQVGGEFDDSLELRYLPTEGKPKPLRTFVVHLRTSSESP